MSQPDNRDRDRVFVGKRTGVTFFTLIQSVCAAFFGVQSEANRKRDFESGKFWHFVAAGIIFVLFFVGLIWGAVRFLLMGVA